MINLAIVGMSAFSQTLYFAVFVYFYISLDTPNHYISFMIASTTLVVVFWGPVVARIIDKSPKRLLFAAAMALICALAILGQLRAALGSPDPAIYIAAALVILFALAFNPLSVIVDQYVVPNLAENDDLAFSKSEKIETTIGIGVSFLLFAAYGAVGVTDLFVAVVISYAILAALLTLGFYADKSTSVSGSVNTIPNPQLDVRQFFYSQRYLIFALVCIAIIGSSFSATVDLIGFNLDGFPFRYVFLLGVFQNAIGLVATFYYEKRAPNNKAAVFAVVVRTLIIGSGAMAAIAYFNISGGYIIVISYFAVVAIFEFGGQLWGLWSITRIREISADGAFATTFSYLRVPRALSSFAGLIFVGFFVEWNAMELFMTFGALVLIGVYVLRNRISA